MARPLELHSPRARDTKATFPETVSSALVLCSADERRVRVIEHALPVPQHEPNLAKTRLRIFYVFSLVRSLLVYISADSGSDSNLISKAMFERLT